MTLGNFGNGISLRQCSRNGIQGALRDRNEGSHVVSEGADIVNIGSKILKMALKNTEF